MCSSLPSGRTLDCIIFCSLTLFFALRGEYTLDPKHCHELSKTDIINLYGRTDKIPLKIRDRNYAKKLRASLIVPSVNVAYSECIEYMSRWFLSKFKDKFFKSTWLEEEHSLNKLRTLRKRDLLCISNPALSIIVDEDITQNRENLDLYNLGANLYNNRARYEDAFFADYDKDLFISMAREVLMMNFTFRMRFDGRPMQLDIAKMCQLAFRINGTEKHYLDLDYEVPRELMLQLCYESLGMCVKDGDFNKVNKFIAYLNMHSRLPFMYKYNLGTGNFDYFVKVPNDPVHITINGLNMDNGMEKGLVKTNYMLSFDCLVRFPTPKFYAYYSMKHWRNIRAVLPEDSETYITRCFDLSKVPKSNENGWPWMATSTYIFQGREVDDIKKGKLMHIDFHEMIGTIRDLIDYMKNIALSPSAFIDIRVFNYTNYIKTNIDWQHYTINFEEPIISEKCYLVIYLDNKFINEKTIELKNYDKQRINPTKNEIGPDLSIKDKKMIY